MKIIRKMLMLTILFCIMFAGSSYAMSQSQEKAGNTLAEFAINFFNNYGNKTKYQKDPLEVRETTYTGQTTNGVYAFDCVGWVSFAIHQSLGLGEDTFTYFAVPPGRGNKAEFDNGFELIEGSLDADTPIDEDILINTVKPGDILFCSPNGPHVVIYVGNEKIVHCYNDLEYEDLYGNDMSYTGYCAIGRITEQAAESINEYTTVFNNFTEEDDDYGMYYGTTKASYVGSYTLGEWLFDKFVGFFDYLAGIITYIYRIVFLGWANIVEELISYTIKDNTGIETVVVGESETTTDSVLEEDSIRYSPGTGHLYTPTANNMNDRLDIEDIIYNRVPFLDVNFLDVNLERYKAIKEKQMEHAVEGDEIQVVSDDSIVYSLRKNIAKWYIVIRQLSIIILLLLLLYLGIRLAISTTSGNKAKYKGMLLAWLTSFIVVFCIHYYMMIVIDINENLVDIFAGVSERAIEESANQTGSQSIYDTIRTRAYSLKLSEGFPATVFYLILIYFLIRFLYVYVKRYFTVMILALMGPIMAIKNCFDKISKGKSKSMSKWMYDFALNVFLQTIHSILYCIFMVMAFDLSTTSVPGFVMALVVLNFIFKAEKIFMNIFDFEGRASSLRDVNENKNYFAEAYKVGVGVTLFGKAAIKHSANAVKGSGRFLGLSALAPAQIGTSVVNRLRNRRARRNGQDSIEYTPIDVQKKIKDKVEKTKNNMADTINNFIYNRTGTRSARLDLHNIKKRDPELYEKTKQALKLKKELRYKTLKRNLGDGANSIRYMAELMMGIPLLVVNTKTGISTLMDATSGLNNMSKKDLGYGYKRVIKGKKGNIATKALNVATFGAVNATTNSFEKKKKEMKKLIDNNNLLMELGNVNELEFEIQREVEKIIQEGKTSKEDIDKIMHESLNKVMSSSKIMKEVSAYMAEKGIKDLNESDLNEIVNNINNQIYADNVNKIVDRYMKNKDNDKLDKADFDKILNKVGKKVEDGVSSVLNDTSIEKITEEYKKEKGIEKLDNNDIKEIERRVNDQVYSKVKGVRDEFMRSSNVDKLSAEQVKTILTSTETHSILGIGVTTEVQDNVSRQFANSDTTLDKKKTVNAIQDAILSSGTKDSSDISKMMRELKTLQQKTKVTYGKKIVDLYGFTEKMKNKMG